MGDVPREIEAAFLLLPPHGATDAVSVNDRGVRGWIWDHALWCMNVLVRRADVAEHSMSPRSHVEHILSLGIPYALANPTSNRMQNKDPLR